MPTTKHVQATISALRLTGLDHPAFRQAQVKR